MHNIMTMQPLCTTKHEHVTTQCTKTWTCDHTMYQNMNMWPHNVPKENHNTFSARTIDLLVTENKHLYLEFHRLRDLRSENQKSLLCLQLRTGHQSRYWHHPQSWQEMFLHQHFRCYRHCDDEAEGSVAHTWTFQMKQLPGKPVFS